MKVRVNICREVELEVDDKFAVLADLYWGRDPELCELAEELEAIARKATGISEDDPAESIYCIENPDGEVMMEW